MRRLRLILAFNIFLVPYALGGQQSAPGRNLQGEGFLIDQSRPYVYLEFDHVGPRTPLREGEPTEGIWLSLKNNCRLPIVILTFGSRQSSAIGLMDEIVPNPHLGTEIPSSGVGYKQDQEGLTDIFRWPDVNEPEAIAAGDRAKNLSSETVGRKLPRQPRGYSHGYEPHTFTLTVIDPDSQVRFSVPIDHVSDDWHFEIPFRLALTDHGSIRQPYSYLAFYKTDLPKDRAAELPQKLEK
jgi:hypothetical protein